MKIGVSGPFSGIYGPIADKLFRNGFETWQREVNAHGGIAGRKIELVRIDNQNTADGAIAACKEARSGSVFLVINMLGFTAETDCEDAAGIPVFDLGPGYVKPWKYGLPAFYIPTSVPTEVSFLASPYMKAKGKKIGIVYDGSQPLTVSAFHAASAELQKQGFQLVHSEKIATNQASFVSEMSRMKASGAETVMLYVALETSGVLRDAKAIGYRPQWYAGSFGASTDIISKATNENLRGVRGLRRMITSESKEFGQYVAKVRQYEGSSAAQNADTTDMLGYALADVAGEMLRIAGRDLGRDSVIAAARTMVDYKNPYLGPVTFKGRQVGQIALFPIECCNSDFTYRALGPPQERF